MAGMPAAGLFSRMQVPDPDPEEKAVLDLLCRRTATAKDPAHPTPVPGSHPAHRGIRQRPARRWVPYDYPCLFRPGPAYQPDALVPADVLDVLL